MRCTLAVKHRFGWVLHVLVPIFDIFPSCPVFCFGILPVFWHNSY